MISYSLPFLQKLTCPNSDASLKTCMPETSIQYVSAAIILSFFMFLLHEANAVQNLLQISYLVSTHTSITILDRD